MKYLRKFQTNADYQAFRGGDDWVTPNVSIITEDDTIVFEPYVEPPYQLTWPVELVQGDNDEKGIVLYNYLVENYTPTPGDTYCFFEDILHLEIDKYVTHYHPGQNMLYWVDAYVYNNGGYIIFPCSYVLHPSNKILNWYLYPDGRCDVCYD